MKKVLSFLIALSMLLALSACGKKESFSEEKLSQLTETEKLIYDLTTDLTNGKYKAVLNNYPLSREVKLALNESSLYSVMFNLTSQNGKFVEIEDVFNNEATPNTTYFANLIFKNGHATISYSVTAEGEISGFFLVPYMSRETLQSAMNKELPEGAKEENVIIGSSFKLSGKLIVPSGGTNAVVIIVHGSGASNMNGEMYQNQPYRDIAYDLAAHGIASLRYDKRSYMYGEVLATDKMLTPYEETVEDVLYAIEYIKTHNIELSDIYIAGHSIGGNLLPEIASYTDDVSGYIFLAGNSSSLLDLMEMQINYISSKYDSTQKNELDQSKKMLEEVKRAKAITENTPNDTPILGAYPTYYRWFAEYKPLELVEKIDVPMLFIQGSRDYQVPPSELDNWLSVLSTRTDVTSALIDGLNHLMMNGEGDSVPAEYLEPNTVDARVSEAIADFVRSSKIHPAIQNK